MPDQKELILARAYAVVQATALSFNDPTAVRNRGIEPNDNRPAWYAMDGDEQRSAPLGDERNRPPNFKRRMEIHPEYYIALEDRKPQNIDVGEDLSARRIALVNALLTDSQLITLCDAGRQGTGAIEYRGCVTDLANGRKMNGLMGVEVVFIYAFDPNNLT